MKRPLPCSARPSPYIAAGDGGWILGGETFRQILVEIDEATTERTLQFRYVLDQERGPQCVGAQHPTLLSNPDWSWFHRFAVEEGVDVPTLRRLAQEGDEEIAYALAWFESARWFTRCELLESWRVGVRQAELIRRGELKPEQPPLQIDAQTFLRAVRQ